MTCKVTLDLQAIYDQGVEAATRLAELRVALSTDEWALDEALRAYRTAPEGEAREVAARRVAEQVAFIRAEVFGLPVESV